MRKDLFMNSEIQDLSILDFQLRMSLKNTEVERKLSIKSKLWKLELMKKVPSYDKDSSDANIRKWLEDTMLKYGINLLGFELKNDLDVSWYELVIEFSETISWLDLESKFNLLLNYGITKSLIGKDFLS